MEITDLTPPFDPDYAGIGAFDMDRAHSEDSSDAHRAIPERFVYDAPVDEWGLAEMSIPERNEFLDNFAADMEDHFSAMDAYYEAEMCRYDDDPNPYHGDYSEI